MGTHRPPVVMPPLIRVLVARAVHLDLQLRVLAVEVEDVRPDRVLPMLLKAALERSITRPLGKLPLSLTRTTTLLPLAILVTLTMAPKGSVMWAAVLAFFW